jgi:parallel beta-helix repeat protein
MIHHIPLRFRAILASTILSLLGGAVAVSPSAAETRVGGKLPKGETVWSKEGNPYIAEGDIVIPKKATLRIGPGVTIRFKEKIADQGGTNPFSLELLVHGKLVIEGAESDTVHLTSDAMAPTWSDWQGIVIQGKEASADLRAMQVEACLEGIKVMEGGTLKASDVTVRRIFQNGIKVIRCTANLDNIFMTQVGNSGGTSIGIHADLGATVNVDHSFIVGVQNGVAYYRGSQGVFRNSVVSNCAARGFVLRNSSPEITGCTVTSNDYGMVITAGAMPKVTGNNIFDNHTADIQVRDYLKPVEMDLGHNWWGQTALGLIEERILDGLDDPRVKCVVKIEPVLTEATSVDDEGR